MMYAIDPDAGWEEQIGLYLRCSQPEAEAIHRALRVLFRGRMSPLLFSRRAGFSFAILVPATQKELEQRWSEVLALAGLIPSSTNSQTDAGRRRASLSGSIRQRRLTVAPPRTDGMHEWEQRFREAVRFVLDDEKQLVERVLPLSLVEGDAARGIVQDALLLDALPLPRRLRVMIGRHALRGEDDAIVALCEQYRQEVLALPASDLLATQVLDAHFNAAQRCNNASLLATGRDLALAFLPELERLGQAEKIRERLRQYGRINQPEASGELVTLSEHLAQLASAAPNDRLSRLEELYQRYRNVSAVRVMLADTHAALGHLDQALELYREGCSADNAAQAATWLLAAGRAREALQELEPYANDSSPRLVGLRGAALAATGDASQACTLLERAWREGERNVDVALAYARVLARAGVLDRAAEPYQIAFEIVPERLDDYDYWIMAEIAAGGGYGDLSGEEEAGFLDRYINRVGRRLRERPDAAEVLRRRVVLRRAAEYPEHLRASLADWLEYLAETGDAQGLDQAIQMVRDLQRQGALSYQDQFELLEGVEQTVAQTAGLSDLLALEYQAIAVAELNLALRRCTSMPAYIADLRRALHFLNRELADELTCIIEQESQALLARNMPVPDIQIEVAPSPNLAPFRLAIAGGHSAVRREVERELRERYGLVYYHDVAPSSEEHIDRAKVYDRLKSADLVVVIASYSGHDLTGIVRTLQQSGEIPGKVVWLTCRGKSGVVRAIVTTLRAC